MTDNEASRETGPAVREQAVGGDSFKSMSGDARAALNAGDSAEALVRSEALTSAFPSKPQGMMLKAQALVAQQRYEEALGILADALQIHGLSPRLLSLTRNIAFQHGKLAEAVDHALTLLDIDPDDRKNRAFLIESYLASEDFVGAELQADDMLKAFPGEPGAVMLMVRTLVARQRVNDALRLLRDWLPVNEADPRVLRLARNVASQHGKSGEAINYARKLLEFVPDDQKNQLFLVQSYLTTGDFASAADQAERLVAAFPNAPDGPMLKAQALVAQDLLEEALETLRNALATFGADPRLLGLARKIAFQLGRFKEAADYGIRLSRVAPDDQKNQALVVQSFLSMGDFASAAAQAEKLAAAFPNDPDGPMLKAQALVARHLVDEALETLSNALVTFEADPRLLGLARKIAFQHGRFKEAADYGIRLSRVAPDDQKNQALIVQSFLSMGDFASAAAQAEKLAAAFPNDPDGPMLKAQALVAQHLVDEALETLRNALVTFEADPRLLGLARKIAFQHGRFDEAADYGIRLSEVAPDNQKNQAFVVQSFLSVGDFVSALAQAEKLAAAFPNEPDGPMLKAHALVAQHLVEEALETLRNALATFEADPKLLGLARNIAFQHGRFKEAIDHGVKLSTIVPEDEKNNVFLVQSYIASGDFDAADRHLRNIGPLGNSVILNKTALHFEQFKRLKIVSPALVGAWEAALANEGDGQATISSGEGYGSTLIQYWSQGAPPDDVGRIVSSWKRLFEREGLGKVELFDRFSAESWINDNAPEFAIHFSKAFHYAMESDIFRIAYASKKPSIYIDIDSWPVENTVEVLKYGIRSSASLLYFRSHRPWIVNGFFISKANCPFFAELKAQCLDIDLDCLPKNHQTIEKTFGPTRYNKVLLDVIGKGGDLQGSRVAGVHGCSTISLDRAEIDFTHEAAVASVKPPFPLSYKGTGDYWKGTSIPD